MSRLARLRSWWKWVIKRQQLESDMDTELSFHLNRQAEEWSAAEFPRQRLTARHGFATRRPRVAERRHAGLGSAFAGGMNWGNRPA